MLAGYGLDSRGCYEPIWNGSVRLLLRRVISVAVATEFLNAHGIAQRGEPAKAMASGQAGYVRRGGDVGLRIT